jgi:hypothetical protein
MSNLWVLMDSEGNPARIFTEEALAKHVEAVLEDAEYYVKEAEILNEEPAYIYSFNYGFPITEEELDVDLASNIWVEVYDGDLFTPLKISKYDVTIQSLSKKELIDKAREINALYRAGQPLPGSSTIAPSKTHEENDHDPTRCKYCGGK